MQISFLGWDIESILYLVFGIIIFGFMIADLGFFNKEDHKTSTQSAIIQSVFWVLIASIFGVFVFQYKGTEPGAEYFSAYMMEYALSVDNIFVIILILRYFRIDEKYYHKILFWGILGALVFRAIFIFVGEALIERYHFILYFFGLFLIYTGFKMMMTSEEDHDINPEDNPVLRYARRLFRFTNDQKSGKFFIRKEGKLFATPLFLVVLLIESTDLIFAVDSIPVAFGISKNPFVIYTSNIFAVMGLRAMFFMLSGILDKFYLLSKGVSFVLIFIGVKMLIEIMEESWFTGITGIHFSLEDYLSKEGFTLLSLSIIIIILSGSIILSLIFPKKNIEETTSTH
jgi:tellurite resistance protein TerC